MEKDTRVLIPATATVERTVRHEAVTGWGTVEALTVPRLDTRGASVTLTLNSRLHVTTREPVSWSAM